MAPLTEAQAKNALAPFHDSIRKVVNQGFRSYLRRRGTGNLFRRTDAAEVFDCVVRAGLSEFASKSRVQIFRNGTTARFLFDGKILARFKKASRARKGQNIETAANNEYLDPMLPYPDAPGATKVEICWKLNSLGTGFSELFVTAPKARGNLWTYDIVGSDQGVIPFPNQKQTQPTARKSVVRLKVTKKASGKVS